MNKCWLMGKIVVEPDFDFLYMKRNISIAYFYIELRNKSIIKVFAYDDIADYIYQNLSINQEVIIEGKIRIQDSLIEIEMKNALILY